MSTFDTRTWGSITAAVAASLAFAAGCSSSSGSKASTGGAGAGGLKTRSTSIGTVLVDSAGRTVYELDGDMAGHQTCTAACQSIWPPVDTNGTQLVINGHPAFTFTGDNSAGQTSGQGVQDQWGHWRALDAHGMPITSNTSTTPATPHGGGY